MPLSDYAPTAFSATGKTKTVFVRGTGPAVIVIHELPGITPEAIRFADWVAEAGFSVFMPGLIGTAGRPFSLGYIAASGLQMCISAEFNVLATGRSSPVTDWLRALARHAHDKCGGRGVGAVGMCFSGGFALSMMLDDIMLAPVLSQPSLPVPITRLHKTSLGIAPEELAHVKARCARGSKVLGLRFKGTWMVPPERFERLRAELGDAFEAIELDDEHANTAAGMHPHSVLTAHLIDRDGEPTKEAAKRVIAFFKERIA